MSILIIDDNFEYADTLRYLLEFSGHRADVALDGPSGLQMALAGAYDAVLCDIGLPGLNGYEVATQLRSNPATSKLRLAAVTAYGTPEAKRQSFAAGFDAHLVKPTPVADILSHLGIKTPDTTA